LNPYFYRSKGGDEVLNRDEEWDGVPVGENFLTISVQRMRENGLEYRLEMLLYPTS
jgi:hypothetical protein